MNNFLHRNTNRCKLIKEVSSKIWDEIISLHFTGQNASEIHYTSKLVSEILMHSKNFNYSIFAKQPGMEKIWGSDIDIYIERGVNDFILFAFQAKVLRKRQVYSDLDKFTKGSYQYQKLENYGNARHCFTNYLFYNGVSNYSYIGLNKCDTQFQEKQYGLSYVSIDSIKKVIKNRTKWNFNYFHPNLASPLSELVCCSNSRPNNIKSYNYKEITNLLDDCQALNMQNVNEYFDKVIENNEKKEDKNIEQDQKRNAELIIIIRNTTSTY